MKRGIAAAAITGTMLTGIGAGAMAFGPVGAISLENNPAEDSTQPAAHGGRKGSVGTPWVTEALDKLVAAGTINQSQADAVKIALRDARPEHRGGPGGPHLALATAAKALGVSEADLAAARHDGKSLADVANEKGVDVDTVIDALVAGAREHLATAVSSGRLTQSQADRLAQDMEARITAHVNGERPPRSPGDRPQLGSRRGPGTSSFDLEGGAVQ